MMNSGGGGGGAFSSLKKYMYGHSYTDFLNQGRATMLLLSSNPQYLQLLIA